MTTSFTPRPPSTRARLAAATTRATLRPITAVIPGNAAGLAISRQIIARSMAAFGSLASGTAAEHVNEPGPQGGRVRGEWVRAGGTDRDDAVILYLHGSGYALCSPATHRRLVSQLSARTGLPVFSLEYRLAPRHRFPAAADDTERAFAWLVEQGWSADRIVVAGDSAGGHLAIDLCLDRVRRGQAPPAAQVLFSPLVDVTFGLSAQREQARPDPMISAAGARRLVQHYIADTDPLHERLTHVVDRHETLPPTLIQAGGGEMLAADAHHLHDLLAASGTEVRLEVWPGQMHVFQAMHRMVPESTRAMSRAARFITTVLAADPVRRSGSAEQVSA